MGEEILNRPAIYANTVPPCICCTGLGYGWPQAIMLIGINRVLKIALQVKKSDLRFPYALTLHYEYLEMFLYCIISISSFLPIVQANYLQVYILLHYCPDKVF
jgi:hypothetical protein